MMKNNNLQRKTASTFDEYESKYSNAVNDAISFTGMDVDFFTRVKADYLKDISSKHFHSLENISVLDIGCGVGNFHSLLSPCFKQLHGIDVSKASIEKAQANHPSVNYSVYEGGTLPFKDCSFDLTYTICVMHHVPLEDWQSFADEMFRVTKPGGLSLVFEHNPQNPLTMRAVNNCPFDEDAVLLNSKKTTGLLENSGFKQIDCRFILSIPAANTLLRAVDKLFSKIPFGAQYYVAGKRPDHANDLISKPALRNT